MESFRCSSRVPSDCSSSLLADCPFDSCRRLLSGDILYVHSKTNFHPRQISPLLPRRSVSRRKVDLPGEHKPAFSRSTTNEIHPDHHPSLSNVPAYFRSTVRFSFPFEIELIFSSLEKRPSMVATTEIVAVRFASRIKTRQHHSTVSSSKELNQHISLFFAFRNKSVSTSFVVGMENRLETLLVSEQQWCFPRCQERSTVSLSSLTRSIRSDKHEPTTYVTRFVFAIFSRSIDERICVDLVFEQYQKARLTFVQSVADLATRPQNIETLQNAGVMALLRPLLLDVVPSVQQTAALALGRLANYSDHLAEAVVRGDILPQLVYSLAEQNVRSHLFVFVV